MSPYETYLAFLSIKHHFTKSNYDVFKYNWKTKASIESFNKRKDRYFFERLSRKKTDDEIKEFFISNFVNSDNANSVYISDLMKYGEENYLNWRKKIQSLFYNFTTEIEVFLGNDDLNFLMDCSNGQHSLLIKKYLKKLITIETLVILNKIFNYVPTYDKLLSDPIWENISLKIKKYSPFLNINNEKYVKVLKETVCG